MSILARMPLCALLAGLALAGPAQAQDPPGSPGAAVNPVAALDLESLAATRALPLFTPTRTAPVVEPPFVPEPIAVEPEVFVAPEPVPPALQLVGLVMSESEQVALLADQATGMVHRLRPGESYDGWVLTIVDGRTVAFSNDGREHLLTMFEQFNGASSVPQGADPLVIPEPEL